MNPQEAITARHSVRRYQHKPLDGHTIGLLQEKIKELNAAGDLHIQLVTDEPRAFAGLNSYGSFRGVENYLVIAGRKADDLDGRAGYYGESLVLYAQTLGLNTCWVGLTYRKTGQGYSVGEGEKIVCVIALGYGVDNGQGHKIKKPEQVSNISEESPAWFRKGVEAALLAPTAINQQKFFFELLSATAESSRPRVRASRRFSLAGYTKVDLGIARLHFEIGAGREKFEWAE